MSETKRVGGVIVSHGQLANELLAAAEAVVGDLNNIVAVSIGWHDDVEMAKGRDRACDKKRLRSEERRVGKEC